MKGDILYPLNQLKDIDKEVYEQQASKYHGREFVMSWKIPTLNCLWNDVLHFSPVHPKEVKKELAKLGQDFGGKFIQVDPEILDQGKATVYLYKNTKGSKELDMEEFTNFTITDLPKYSEFPEATANYYKKMINGGKSPLLFVRIPHILYQGSVNTKDCEIIEI